MDQDPAPQRARAENRGLATLSDPRDGAGVGAAGSEADGTSPRSLTAGLGWTVARVWPETGQIGIIPSDSVRLKGNIQFVGLPRKGWLEN